MRSRITFRFELHFPKRREDASALLPEIPNPRQRSIAKSKKDSVVWRALHFGAWDSIFIWDLEPAAARQKRLDQIWPHIYKRRFPAS